MECDIFFGLWLWFCDCWGIFISLQGTRGQCIVRYTRRGHSCRRWRGGPPSWAWDTIIDKLQPNCSIKWDSLQQILFRLRVILPNGGDFRTAVFLWTAATCLHLFGYSTFANLAQRAAEYGLGPIHTASLAVDMFWKDWCMIQLRP